MPVRQQEQLPERSVSAACVLGLITFYFLAVCSLHVEFVVERSRLASNLCTAYIAKLLFACLLLLQGVRVDFVRESSRLSVLVSNLCTAYIAQQNYYLPVYYCCRGSVWTLLGSTAVFPSWFPIYAQPT
jgi:hypothetical protein